MNIATILCAGNSIRFGSKQPKILFSINKKPLIYYTINCFEKCKDIDEIVLVTKQDFIDDIKGIITKYNFKKVNYIISGGDSRQESSKKAAEFLSTVYSSKDKVLIHDGARPNIDSKIISECIKKLSKFDSVTVAIPSTDTIGISDGKTISSIPPRKNFYRIQTPQGFKVGIFSEFHKNSKVDENITDDSSLAIKNGYSVALVIGNNDNIKVTTLDDINHLNLNE